VRKTRTPVRKLIVRAALAIGVALLGFGGYRFWVDEFIGYEPTSVPSCSWPLQVHGIVTAEQAGLVRCYLRALAQRDAAGLLAVADDDPSVRITGAQLAHSADARAGVASATFVPNPSDDAFVSVTVRYADGVSVGLGLMIANPSSAHSWRLEIGVSTSPDSNAPPPTTRGPAPPSTPTP
jgi:hypothetical protein